MPDALCRVPGPFEVDILQAEIGRDQDFMTTRDGKHGAVVPDAQPGPGVVLRLRHECRRISAFSGRGTAQSIYNGVKGARVSPRPKRA